MRKFIRKLRVRLIDWLAGKDIIVAIGVEFDSIQGVVIRNNEKFALLRDNKCNMHNEGTGITCTSA
jgi:hypothetical protein